MEEQVKGYPLFEGRGSDRDLKDDNYSTTGDGHPDRQMNSTTGDGHPDRLMNSTTGDGHPARDDSYSTTGDGHPDRAMRDDSYSTTGDGHPDRLMNSTTGDGHPDRGTRSQDDRSLLDKVVDKLTGEDHSTRS